MRFFEEKSKPRLSSCLVNRTVSGDCSKRSSQSRVVDMSSIPMGAHASFKVREHLDGGAKPGGKQPGQGQHFFQQSQKPESELQYNPPAQYNGKLMNSIWGMYNRYSVHNFKSQINFEKV